MYKSLSCSEGEDKHLLHIALEKNEWISRVCFGVDY